MIKTLTHDFKEVNSGKRDADVNSFVQEHDKTSRTIVQTNVMKVNDKEMIVSTIFYG